MAGSLNDPAADELVASKVVEIDLLLVEKFLR